MRFSRMRYFSVAMLAIGGAASAGMAQTLIGGFQGAGDATDAGWTNVNTGNPITADPTSTFVAAGVPGYAQSLQESQTLNAANPSGYNAAAFASPSQLQIQLSPAQILAFNADSYLTFTFSAPTGFNNVAYTSGYNQIYNINYNAAGVGYTGLCEGGSAAATWGVLSQSQSLAGDGTVNNQNGEPNFYFPPSGGAPLDSEIVTVNYSSIKAAVILGGEGYVQFIFQGNTAGTKAAPMFQDFNNVELSTGAFGTSVPEPVSASLIGIASLGLLARRRARIAR